MVIGDSSHRTLKHWGVEPEWAVGAPDSADGMGRRSEAAKRTNLSHPPRGEMAAGEGLDASPCHTDLGLKVRGAESCWTEHHRDSLTAHPVRSSFRALQQPQALKQ